MKTSVIAIPLGLEWVHNLFMMSLTGIAGHCMRVGRTVNFMPSSASLGTVQSRNSIMKGVELIESQGAEVEWILWLDADMVVPGNAMERLIAHNKDIVGATYVRRGPPYDVLGKSLSGGPETHEGGLVEVAAVPTGVLLTRRSVFEGMKKPIWRCLASEEKEEMIPEDYLFCIMQRQMGRSIWIDFDLTKEIGHIGNQVFWPPADGQEEARVSPPGKNLNIKRKSGLIVPPSLIGLPSNGAGH